MFDTPIEVYRRQVAIWQAKSFSERMRLAGEADNMAWRDAKRVVERAGGGPAELFLALHGDSLSPEILALLAAAIRGRAAEIAAR